jgi:hypothetical protein
MSTRARQSDGVMKLNTNEMEVLANDIETANPVIEGGHLFNNDRLTHLESGVPGGETPAATEARCMEGVVGEDEASTKELATATTASEGQLELGLRAPAAGRPRRVVRARRYAVARWWFARMRETVRSTREWNGGEVRRPGTEQALLTLTQSPTRFEGRRAA